MAAKRKTGPTGPTAGNELPALRFPTAAAFDAWLAKHHATSTGIRLELARAGSAIASVTTKEAVELALTWGWIDGRTKSLDDSWWHQQFTPRGPKSPWSKVNREKVEALTKADRMHPGGLAAVAAAQADGRWDAAYDPPSRAAVPDDLAAELARSPRAAAFFEGLDARNRYAILHRLQTAKKPETRTRRLAAFMAMLVEGRRIHE